MTTIPSRAGDRYVCFTLIREAKGWGGPYGQRWIPCVWRCDECGAEIPGELAPWIKKRLADHHECGHAPCDRCGTMLPRRKDGTPRQHRVDLCPGKTDGDKIEREFVKHMTTREFA
jgi:hypothetical protein